jgi:hypothetical protein
MNAVFTEIIPSPREFEPTSCHRRGSNDVLHLQMYDGDNVCKSYIVNLIRTNPECVFSVLSLFSHQS